MIGSKLRFFGLGATILILSIVRFPQNLIYPAFWAEDGTLYFKHSLEQGVASVWTPVIGAYQTLPRLVAFAACAFPVYWTPTVYVLVAGVVSSLSLSVFSRPGLSWLVPSDQLRAVLCVLFSLVPGTVESLFALCTMNYPLFAALLFLLLERDAAGAWMMGWRRALLVSFLWFSVGQSVVFAPLIAYFFVRTRNRAYLLCLASLAVSVLLNFVSVNAAAPAAIPAPATLLSVYADNVFVRLIFLPLVGALRVRPVLELSEAHFLLLSLPALLLFLWAAQRIGIDRDGKAAIAVATASMMAVFPLTAAARSYGLGDFRRPELLLVTRHSFVPSILALVLWSFVLASPAASRAWRLAGRAALLWVVVNVMVDPLSQRPVPLRPFIWEWPSQAAGIESVLSERRAGRLGRPVVVTRILCRPGAWAIKDLTITPR